MRDSIFVGAAAILVTACSGQPGNNIQASTLNQTANVAAPSAGNVAIGNNATEVQEAVYDGPPRDEAANYSASGSEPFWAVTIANGQMNYQEPGRGAGTDTPLRTRLPNGFEFANELLTVRFTSQPCTAASGESLPYTVRVTVEGRTRNGCGREGGPARPH